MQLSLARRKGFRVPRTLVSNDPNEVEAFIRAVGPTVVKPLFMGFLERENGAAFLFTSPVGPEDLGRVESASLCPAIYQEQVDKDFDVRITVVGRELFVTRIKSNKIQESPDWRSWEADSLEYEEMSAPTKLANTCIDLVRDLGLDFGALDFGVDRAGHYWFFEINPSGQWAWLDEEIGLGITDALVHRLVSCAQRTLSK